MPTVSKRVIERFPMMEGIKFGGMDFVNTMLDGDKRTWKLSAKDNHVYAHYQIRRHRVVVYNVGSDTYPMNRISEMLEHYKVVDALYGIADELKLPLELSQNLADMSPIKRLFDCDDDDSDIQQPLELRQDS